MDSACRIVLVVGDFRRGAPEAFKLRELGVRVSVAGLGTAALRKKLEEHGIEGGGLVRSRKAAVEAAVERLGGADVVLFSTAEWAFERQAVLEAERDLAASDGRFLRPLLWRGDPRYRFLRSSAQWAGFAAARARGADPERAKEFASRQSSGHTKQNRKRTDGGASRPRAAKRRGTA